MSQCVRPLDAAMTKSLADWESMGFHFRLFMPESSQENLASKLQKNILF
jgi:hypothetical protein